MYDAKTQDQPTYVRSADVKCEDVRAAEAIYEKVGTVDVRCEASRSADSDVRCEGARSAT